VMLALAALMVWRWVDLFKRNGHWKKDATAPEVAR